MSDTPEVNAIDHGSKEDCFDIMRDLARKLERQRDRLAEALRDVCEMAKWQYDEDADENNTSPDDMTAHINGLIVKKICAALAELEKGKL
tara:strand:+ start:562 stop:831 length:270 start_codon:yes stop_codon:yes gene_type:complete